VSDAMQTPKDARSDPRLTVRRCGWFVMERLSFELSEREGEGDTRPELEAVVHANI